MYSDPPWGEGNIKYWASINKRHTGQEIEPASLPSFLGAVFGAARDFCDGYLLIEYGTRWRKEIIALGEQHGFDFHGQVDLRYRSGAKLLPLDLIMFARPGVNYPAGYKRSVEGTHGYKTLQMAFHPLAEIVKKAGNLPSIALDPCCGMGYTAQAAIDTGLAFRGNELNAKRLEKTKARLLKTLKARA